jgi:hypothetical protein
MGNGLDNGPQTSAIVSLNGYLPSRPDASLAAAKLTMSLATSSSCSNTRKVFRAEHLMSAGQLLLNRHHTTTNSFERIKGCLLVVFSWLIRSTESRVATAERSGLG